MKESWSIIARFGTEYAVVYKSDPLDTPALSIDVGFEGPTPELDAIIHRHYDNGEIHWEPAETMPAWAERK